MAFKQPISFLIETSRAPSFREHKKVVEPSKITRSHTPALHVRVWDAAWFGHQNDLPPPIVETQ